jgi:hypothetical protein
MAGVETGGNDRITSGPGDATDVGARRPRRPRAARVAVETTIGLMAAALIGWAASANAPWVARHFMPQFRLPHAQLLAQVGAVRSVAALAGLALLFGVRPGLGRRVEARGLVAASRDLAPTLLAALLALASAEAILRLAAVAHVRHQALYREPQIIRDRELGWLPRPDRVGFEDMNGRRISYALDADGFREAAPGRTIDRSQPSVLFVGESVMMGHGVAGAESAPAQVEAITGVQSANLAVDAYSLDQQYLRLKRELPRFQRPVAVVILFLPSVSYKLLDPDRPHLDARLAWRPQPDEWRLAYVARRLFPYRSEAEISDAVGTTRALLRATIALARAHGARPIVLVPVFQPEPADEAALRRRVLDDGAIAYVPAAIPQAWRLSGDGHPDARGAHALAVTAAQALSEALPLAAKLGEEDRGPKPANAG